MELAYVYVDLGDQRYKALVDEMVTSARAVMPDVKITQISDNKTPIYPGADALFAADVVCDKDSICAFKGHFMAEFAMQCQEPLILCDVDLIWQKPMDCTANLGVMTRDNMASMPINTGLIFSTPRAIDLWRDYQNICDNLHDNGLGGWYCDQIAASIAWLRNDDVSTYAMDDWAYAPKGPDDQAGKDAYTIHLKGPRKQWLHQFKRKAA